MDLAVCVTCVGENNTSEHHLDVFSVDKAFIHHLMATHPSHPIGMMVILATPVKAIQNSASYPLNSW